VSAGTLKKNVLANLAGSVWTAILALLCVPLYLKYLGIEAYGLIGFFGTIMAVFGIMDLGLGTALNRGLARLSVRRESIGEQRDLLRTLELVYWSVAIIIGSLTFALAGPVAARWVHPHALPAESVASAVRRMGIVAALQFPFALYQAGLMGLQRQFLVNAITISTATLRTAGSIIVLAFISPTVTAFFTWQALVTFIQTGATVLLTWRVLASPVTARFRRPLLRQEWRFAAGVSANAIIGIFLTQSDKLLLTRIVPLAEFGYYMLAGTVAATLWWIIGPVNAALFPRFTQLIELGDDVRLCSLYHTACQVIAVVLLPVAVTLALFSRPIVFVWTQNAGAAEGCAVLIALLVTGTCINGLTSVAGFLQASAGWPQLLAYTNLGCAIVLVPAIPLLGIRYGGPGAASVWVVLNCVYLFVAVPLMHRRLLRGGLWRWYGHDVLRPLVAVLVAGVAARVAMPHGLPRVAAFFYIAAAAAGMAAGAIAAAPRARAVIFQTLMLPRPTEDAA